MTTLFAKCSAAYAWCEQRIALFKVRMLEAELDGQLQALEYVQDVDTRVRIMLARERTHALLAQARSQMIAKYPPGTRFTWSNG